MLDPKSDLLHPILNLLVTAGYTGTRNPNVSVADNIAGGLAWCISATNAVRTEFELLSDPDFGLQEDKTKVAEVIEAALRSMECPYSLEAHQIKHPDYNGVYPVVQWLVSSLLASESDTNDEVADLLHQIEDEEHTVQQLEKELNNTEHSLKILHADLYEQNQKKISTLDAMQLLHEKVEKEGAINMVQRLLLLLESSKAFERQESDLRSQYEQKYSVLQADVIKLEENISRCSESRRNSDDFGHSSCDPLEKLDSAKSELAVKLRAVLMLKRRFDDIPSASELIQYERRFSELYVQIQEKLQQTRKYYATYNALLEIKDLVLKETSILNSINSQFQDAIVSPAGRMKLIDSMEGIIKGTQQKLGKVQLAFQAEQKVCDAFKENYTASIVEQRRCSSLLKAFQEEYAKNERLRSQTST